MGSRALSLDPQALQWSTKTKVNSGIHGQHKLDFTGLKKGSEVGWVEKGLGSRNRWGEGKYGQK